jgi:hypothetical protein
VQKRSKLFAEFRHQTKARKLSLPRVTSIQKQLLVVSCELNGGLKPAFS